MPIEAVNPAFLRFLVPGQPFKPEVDFARLVEAPRRGTVPVGRPSKSLIEPIQCVRRMAKPKLELVAPLMTLAIKAAEEVFGVSRDRIMSRLRDYETVDARFAIWATLIQHGASTLLVGKAFTRDHGTIISGMRRFLQFLETRKDYREKWDRFSNAVVEFETKGINQ